MGMLLGWWGDGVLRLYGLVGCFGLQLIVKQELPSSEIVVLKFIII